jgi:Na+-driven multidrug efflux pump
MERQNTRGDLLPFPRLVLVVSAVVQFIFGAVCLFLPGLWHSFFWPPPLQQIPDVAREYAAINYLGTTIAAVYAPYQGTGDGARVYFAFSFPYNAMAIIVAFTAAFTNGIPLIMWLYVLLAALYLPAVALAWAQQSRGRRSREARVR